MTREEVNRLAKSKIDHNKFLILELITGMGKTKLSIDLINHLCTKDGSRNATILVLVAKTVHKNEWKREIEKWGGIITDNIIFECYESLHKYKGTTFDIIIADEMQHFSNNRLETLSTITINTAFIGLSATIKREMKDYFSHNYNATFVKCGLKEAVEDNVLPEPTVYLIPLNLDNTKFKYKTKKFNKDTVVTQQGYYDTISSLIEWYKNKYYNSRSERLKNLWLSTAGKRLKWLSSEKEGLIIHLLEKFKNYKTLTFCSSIEQSELLGKYNITSKNKRSIEYLNMFNENKIKHITACSILNEGVNLTNCKIGIFCNLNSSEIVTKQRIGRILRHKEPIIIVPYFVNTREEELVNKMLDSYNKEMIKVINNINNIII